MDAIAARAVRNRRISSLRSLVVERMMMLLNVGVPTSAIQLIVCLFPIDAIDRSDPPLRMAVLGWLAAGGVGIGAGLRVARPPLLVRRWRANRSKRQDQSALRQPRDGKSGNGSSPPVGFSEPEAKANRGIDRVAMEEAVRQAAIDL